MKKIILISGLFIALIVTTTKAQTSKQPDFTFCNGASESISLSDLRNCTNLQTNLKEVKIRTFVLSILINGVFVDYKCLGNRLSDEAMAKIKTISTTKVMITNITCIVDNGSKNYPDIILTVK